MTIFVYIYILSVFTEKPYNKAVERNNYIESRDVTWR